MGLAGAGTRSVEGESPGVTGRRSENQRERLLLAVSEECATKGLKGNMEGSRSDVCRAREETTAWSPACEQGLVGGACGFRTVCLRP